MSAETPGPLGKGPGATTDEITLSVAPTTPTSKDVDLVAAAQWWARKGIPVFPCGPDKRPLTTRGFYDATTDENRIPAMFANAALMGIPTGSGAGIFVLDVDMPLGPDALVDLQAERGDLPETLTVRTMHGGTHYYFRAWPGAKSTVGKLGDGIDTRGEGGYVIAPPSPGYEIVGHTAPAEAPSWLKELATKGAEEPVPRVEAPMTAPVFTELSAEMQEAARTYIERAVEGIAAELATTASWPAGHSDDYGRGWEKTQADAALRLASLALATWTPLDIEDARRAFLGAAPTDTGWTSVDVERKWTSQARRATPVAMPATLGQQRGSIFSDPPAGAPAEGAGTTGEREPAATKKSPENLHRGQARIAYRLAAKVKGKLIYVNELGWFHWDGKRWAQDTKGAAKRAVLATLQGALVESVRLNEDARSALREDVRACESASGLRGVLDIAAALSPFAHTVADLDADPYLLNCANGTLDLRTGELRAHEPADLITKVTRAAYAPHETPSGAWPAFLARVLPSADVRAFLQRYVGLSLAGTVLEHKLAILTGTGRNGKGVFYGAVSNALGDYATTAEPDLFMHREGAHPTGEMDLRGVRWAVVSESDKGRKLAEATVKRLTGGDRIKARRMRKDFVEFDPSHTAALVTNHLPAVSGDDTALWERLLVIPFDVYIPPAERDPELGNRLKLDADAVLTWAVEGWRTYRSGGLAAPTEVQRATEDYHAGSDTVGQFIKDRCAVNPAFNVRFAELFAAYQAWGGEEGVETLGRRDFGLSLDRANHPGVKGSGNVAYRKGLRIAAGQEG